MQKASNIFANGLGYIIKRGEAPFVVGFARLYNGHYFVGIHLNKRLPYPITGLVDRQFFAIGRIKRLCNIMHTTNCCRMAVVELYDNFLCQAAYSGQNTHTGSRNNFPLRCNLCSLYNGHVYIPIKPITQVLRKGRQMQVCIICFSRID